MNQEMRINKQFVITIIASTLLTASCSKLDPKHNIVKEK